VYILIAAGVLPGDRGVWRSMHLGGRLHEETAHRLWPAWTEWKATSLPEASPEQDRVNRSLAE